MAKIEGLEKLAKMLQEKAERTKAGSVVVGYKAAYAIYVHEDLEAFHTVGQAKYLEQPAREHQKDIARYVRELVGKGMSLENALYQVGLFLQRESQKLVPVDTGNLKAGAFTEKEGKTTS